MFIICLTCAVIPQFKVKADDTVTETLEQKIVRFTDSDLLDGETEGGVNIRDFAKKYKKGEYRPTGYGSQDNYEVTGIIGKVIPIELLYTKGSYIYIGNEYGFVVYTYTNNYGESYFSALLIIDFSFDCQKDENNEEEIANQPVYRMETLFEGFYEICSVNGSWQVWHYNGGGTQISLKNVFIAASLQNENENNGCDRNYNKQTDDGDVILSANIDYCAHKFDKVFDSKALTEWSVKRIITPVLKVGVAVAPVDPIIKKIASTTIDAASNIILNALVFSKDTDGFFNEAENIWYQKEDINTTIGTHDSIKQSFNTKNKQKAEDSYESYSREVYVAQGQMDGAVMAEFVPDSSNNDKNSFVELQLITSGDANSRLFFTVGFEAVVHQLGIFSYDLTLNSDGNVEIALPDDPNTTPVVITHSVEHKIYDRPAKFIRDVFDTAYEIKDKAPDLAYLLDPNGYMLYKFQPKFNNKFAFGKYTFKTVPDGTQPSTRIHLFKSVHNGVALNEEALIKKTRDELLNSEYLLAYNNTDISDMWELPYEFTDMGSEQANTYYVLYKYEFDYTGGGSAFRARSEFVPDELKTDKTITKTLNSGQETYFVFKPAKTGNYVINADGLSSANIAVYDRSGNFIIDGNRNNLHSLLDENKKYVIKIKNSGSQSSVNFSVNFGEEVVLDDFKYVASFSIKPSETQYYKFVPQNLSGSYKVVGDGIEYCVISWYNQYLEEIKNQNNAAFLSKNQTYYIGIENILVTENVSGEFILEYQNDVVSFTTRVGVYKEEYKQYLAYIIEGANVEGLNKAIVFAINRDIVYNGEYDSDVFVYNLSDYYFDSKTIKFTCELIINGNQKIALAPVNIITADVITYQKGVTISAEYSSILFTQSYEYNYIDACLTVPASVKVLTMSDVNSNGMRGFYINVESSSEPLIINLKNVRFFAPLNKPAISSKRDIIINCFEKATLYGGAGSVDETYPLKHASAGIEMRQNNLYLNGSGKLYISGGGGGKKTDWQVFSYNEAASNGGTGIEVNNLVSAVSVLEVDGGYGGVGGYGKAGEAGKNGSGVQSNGVGARGGDGGEGSRGCNGGAGGSAIWILGDYFAVYTSQLSLYGGKGGNGGSGGTGGKGGKGAPGKDGGLFGGQCAGGRGGDGGKGGNGGDYGLGLPALSTRDINRTINFTGVDFTAMFEKCGNNGTAGRGGDGGFGGKGGAGGKNTWGAQAANGADGNVGENGSDGGNPSPRPYGDETGDYDYMQSIVNACIIEKLGKEEAYRLFGHEIFCGELNCSHIK